MNVFFFIGTPYVKFDGERSRLSPFLDAFSMTEKTLDKHIITLRKFKPEFILAITSAIYLMAQYMQKRGIDDIKPKAILTSCEVLFDHQRDIIENAGYDVITLDMSEFAKCEGALTCLSILF